MKQTGIISVDHEPGDPYPETDTDWAAVEAITDEQIHACLLYTSGYLEAEDFEKCCAGMKDHPINARWQSEMAPFFEKLEAGAADDNMFPLEEVFHLD